MTVFMHKLSQGGMLVPSTQKPTSEVTDTQEIKQREEKEKQVKEQEKRVLNQQLRLIQEKLRTLMAQVTPPVKQEEEGKFEDVQRQEQLEKGTQESQQELTKLQQEQQPLPPTPLQQEFQQQQSQFPTQQRVVQEQGLIRQSRRWVKSERANAEINLGDIIVYCDVAATPKQQMSGLQAYSSLSDHRGLWFPQMDRRVAQFHMGSVSFPIDIIFIDGDRVNKIVANIKPKQFGSWSSVCTDVIEVNGGWCFKNDVSIGDKVVTPLTNKKRAISELERVLDTSWSAPQDARIKSEKESAATSWDTLRTITTASEDFEQELFKTFPFLKEAIEHRLPDTTDKRQPGTIDTRNPTDRFEHHTLPDEFNPFGDGDAADVDPFSDMGNPGDDGPADGVSRLRYQYTRGFDPALSEHNVTTGVTPYDPKEEGLKAPIRPSASKVALNVDPDILVHTSVKLYDANPPEWNEDNTKRHEKIALLTDENISNWIDSLGFDQENEDALRQVMFTDDYKRLLGDALIKEGKIKEFDLFESDLLLYQ